LPNDVGDEKAALDSVYALFPATRSIIRQYGRDCIEFTKIAIVVLNQIVRPFTAKWHPVSLAGKLSADPNRSQFRADLSALQNKLITYAHMLAGMAGVEDLTTLEDA
jgi:hypothetical protein